MSQILEMTAIKRGEVGRGETRTICKAKGLVPAVIYGAGKDNQNIYVNAKEINHAMQKPEFYSHIIDLDVDGSKEQVMLKDSQIAKLVGVTKNSVTSIRNKSYWNYNNLNPKDPVALNLFSQKDLVEALEKAERRIKREKKEKEKAKQAKEISNIE